MGAELTPIPTPRAAGHRFVSAASGREESVSRFSRFKSPRSSAAVW